MLIQEAAHCLDTELFLDEYPQWEVGGLHHPIILQRIFVHAAKAEQKEAERLICWGYWHSLPGLNPEVVAPTIQLVGYKTSWKEIQDLYHEVYLLKRLPSLLPCRPKLIEEAIQDILSSLRSHLWRWGGITGLEEVQRGAATWPQLQSSQTWGRDHSCDEALWEAREAHWWTLEATHVLELNIKRLNKDAEGTRCWCAHSCSCSCSLFQGTSWERCMTFCKPKEGAPSSKRLQTEPLEYLTRGQLEESNLGPHPP